MTQTIISLVKQLQAEIHGSKALTHALGCAFGTKLILRLRLCEREKYPKMHLLQDNPPRVLMRSDYLSFSYYALTCH